MMITIIVRVNCIRILVITIIVLILDVLMRSDYRVGVVRTGLVDSTGVCKRVAWVPWEHPTSSL
jgi:hypothetical protein